MSSLRGAKSISTKGYVCYSPDQGRTHTNRPAPKLALACACLKQAFNVVFSPAWAVRRVFAAAQHWHLASPCSPSPGARVAVHSLLPGVRVAIHGMSSQLAHQKAVTRLMDVRSACGEHSPRAACSTSANWAEERTVSPNGFQTAGSNLSGYRSAYCSGADSRSEAAPTYCSWTYCSCWAASPDGSPPSNRSTMGVDFEQDGSPLDCPWDEFRMNDSPSLDFPQGSMRALASATSSEHGRCLQQPWQLRHRVL
jgi:hypothetical protein